jgi:beta-lactamase class A
MLRLLLLIGLSTAVVCSQSLDQKIRQATANSHGVTSLFAKNLDTGATYGLRENERVRTASTIKLAIMVTVFDAVAPASFSNFPMVCSFRFAIWYT